MEMGLHDECAKMPGNFLGTVYRVKKFVIYVIFSWEPSNVLKNESMQHNHPFLP